MIRYDPDTNIWVSGKNPSEQGMPTADLTGDTEVCECNVCELARNLHFGTNFKDLPE